MEIRRKNKMTRGTYLYMGVSFIIAVTLLFRAYYFRPLNGWSLRSSNLLFFSLIIMNGIIGGSIAFWRDRTAGALIMISFTPVMLYRVIYSITYGTTLMKVLFPAILIACICHIVLRSIRQNKDENLYNAYCSFAVTISIFILILLFINLESSAKAINERNTIWSTTWIR